MYGQCVRSHVSQVFQKAPDDKAGMLQVILSARGHARQFKHAVKHYRLSLIRGRRRMGQDSFEQAWKRNETQKAKVAWCKLRKTQHFGGHVCGICGVAWGKREPLDPA